MDEMPSTDGADASPGQSPSDEVLIRTTAVLVKTLRALGNAGHPDAANRLAAQAWSALRHTHPREAERINGIMHYLARLPDEPTTKVFGTVNSLVEWYRPRGGTDPVVLADALCATVFDSGEFTWDYLEQGPEVWRVRLGRVAA